MIFKGLRISARIGKAHGLILNKKYQEAYDLLLSIKDCQPEEYLLPIIYSDMGGAEYHLGKYQECYKHMDYCVKQSVADPELWSGCEHLELLELISWYHGESSKKI